MTDDVPVISDLFRSTIPYYTAHRPTFPSRLIEEVIARVGLTARDRMLDLGCGPGHPAIEFARLGPAAVTAMDPDPVMLATAREAAEKAGVTMEVVQGSSADLTPAAGPFKLVTMARSFHWMDRAATLAALDDIVAPTGAVVLLSDLLEQGPGNRWEQVLKQVQDDFTPQAPHGPRFHAAVLLESPFSEVETFAIIRRTILTMDAIVGYAFTLPKSSPQTLGHRMDHFAAELRERLLDLSPGGRFVEIRRFEAMIARRPGATDIKPSNIRA